jgi:hypothetical protein
MRMTLFELAEAARAKRGRREGRPPSGIPATPPIEVATTLLPTTKAWSVEATSTRTPVRVVECPRKSFYRPTSGFWAATSSSDPLWLGPDPRT